MTPAKEKRSLKADVPSASLIISAFLTKMEAFWGIGGILPLGSCGLGEKGGKGWTAPCKGERLGSFAWDRAGWKRDD